MASREKMRQIDAQWQALQPGLGRKNHNGERKMLHEVMADGEHIEVLVGCVWGPEKAFRAGASRWDRMTQYDGIAVVTESRVALLKKRGLSKLTADMPLLTIESVDVDGEGAVTLTGQSSTNWIGDGDATVFKLRDVQNGYARNFADRVRERMASDAASVEALLPRVLEDGEHVEQWAGCAAGTEEIREEHPKPQGGGSYYFQARAYQRPALAVATGRRIFFHDLHNYGSCNGHTTESCPHGTILSVEHWGGRGVRFVDVNGQVYDILFDQDGDATLFAGLFREHTATAARRLPSRETRIVAEWKLHHRVWDFRNNHGGELRKLGEIMEDDEHIEALAWGTYERQRSGEESQIEGGIIAATGHRLLFVYNGVLSDGSVSQLPYNGISKLEWDGGRLSIRPSRGFDEYEITGIDDQDPRDSRERGHREAFVARLQTIIENASK